MQRSLRADAQRLGGPTVFWCSSEENFTTGVFPGVSRGFVLRAPTAFTAHCCRLIFQLARLPCSARGFHRGDVRDNAVAGWHGFFVRALSLTSASTSSEAGVTRPPFGGCSGHTKFHSSSIYSFTYCGRRFVGRAASPPWWAAVPHRYRITSRSTTLF